MTSNNADLLSGLSIFLVGMMGVGKTSVGKELAHLLDYRFFDSDELIERVTGKSVSDIFASDGEAGFRDIETRVLQQLAAYTRSAIATGGGIVIKQYNWSYLQQGLVVWLDAPVEVILARLAGDTTRPLLQTPNPQQTLTELLEKRRLRYALADLRVPIGANQNPEEIALEVMRRIPSVLKDRAISHQE